MLIPTRDNVIVKRVARAEKTVGGLFIPQNAKEDVCVEAEVISCGPGKVLDNGVATAMGVKPGDRVLIPRWTGEITHDGEKVAFIKEEAIFAVLEP